MFEFVDQSYVSHIIKKYRCWTYRLGSFIHISYRPCPMKAVTICLGYISVYAINHYYITHVQTVGVPCFYILIELQVQIGIGNYQDRLRPTRLLPGGRKSGVSLTGCAHQRRSNDPTCCSSTKNCCRVSRTFGIISLQ